MCHVDVLAGGESLSPRTAAEDKLLKGKPASWRLSCQALAEDGPPGRALVVQALPQAVKK